MSKSISNEELVKRVIDSKAIDFKAIGKIVAELGPDLVRSDLGVTGAVIGGRYVLACFKQPINTQAIADLGKADIGSTLLNG